MTDKELRRLCGAELLKMLPAQMGKGTAQRLGGAPGTAEKAAGRRAEKLWHTVPESCEVL